MSKFSIRTLFNSPGTARKAGSSANPDAPLKRALIPLQFETEATGRVARVEDLFSDSPVMLRLMLKAQAYDIVDGSAVFDNSNRLTSADVVWADGKLGSVEYDYTDANGSYIAEATKAGGITPTIAKESATYNTDGECISSSGGVEDPDLSITVQEELIPFCMKYGEEPTYNEANTGIQRIKITDPISGTFTVIVTDGYSISKNNSEWSSSFEIDLASNTYIYIKLKEGELRDNFSGLLSIYAEGVTLVYTEALAGYIGDGTESNPYPVAIPAQLIAIEDDPSANYLQYADIDLSAYDGSVSTPTGVGWEPLGNWNTDPFTGVYDGGGHKIINLYIRTTEPRNPSPSTGLFESINGEVKSLRIEDADISSAIGDIGILAGKGAVGMFVEEVFVSGSIEGNGGSSTGFIGGLVGTVGSGSTSFSKCLANVDITSDGEEVNIGGLCGYVELGTDIFNCGCVGSITDTSDTAVTIGGLVGTVAENAENCFAAMDITSNESASSVLGVAGAFGGGFGDLELVKCFWDVSLFVSESPDEFHAEGETTENMKIQSTYSDWDFVDTWELIEGQYPNPQGVEW